MSGSHFLAAFYFCNYKTDIVLSKIITLSLDAMGGDDAPGIVIDGAAQFAKKNKNVRFLFFGDQARIAPLVNKNSILEKISEIHHTDDMIPSDMKPSVALRQGRKSSMRLAINAVAEGKADAIVSAGNTGALMAISKFVLKTLPGITRPAIASVMPTMKKDKGVVMLDLGANVDCSARILVEFAVLGSVYSHLVCGVKNPKVGLLNIGSEEMKGHDNLREAAVILEEHLQQAEYMGFVEGTDINKGVADVIVTDGFTGNVTLKTVEGTAKMLAYMVKSSFKSSPLSYLGLPFIFPALRKLKQRMDPRLYNGGMFMGLRGLCVKSHGGADALAFANAIKVACDLADTDFNKHVADVLNVMAHDDPDAEIEVEDDPKPLAEEG